MAKLIFSAFCDESGEFDIRGQMAACKANGITHMELRGLSGKNISDFTVEEAKEIKKAIDEQGMKVSSIGSHYGKIEITDDFEPHFKAYKNTIEVAKILGAKYIRVFSFYFTKGEKFEDYKDEVMRRMEAMADYAQENGIMCCHENESHIYGDIPERCLEMLQKFEGKLFGIFDPANYIMCGVDVDKAYDMLENYTEYMHIKDAYADTRDIVPAGEGDGHIGEIIKRFATKNGERVLTLEPHLKVFDGLAGLESDSRTANKKPKYEYASNAESFAAAAKAMIKLAHDAQPIRFGIVGMGNMGGAHRNNFNNGKIKEMRLVAAADTDPKRLEGLDDLKTFNSAQEMFDSGEVDAVIIATPHYDHPSLVIAALKAGLHVVSEKPAGVYTKQVREMNEIAQKSDKVFAMMFNQRTNHVYRKMKELVSSGEFGEIRRVNWVITNWYRTQAYYNSGGWRATWAGEGGGVLLNQCPHNLDLWQWICGMPSKIRAFCHNGKWHDIEVEDDVTIYAEYPNGATGVFVTTTGDSPGTNRFEIVLDGAQIICDDGELTVNKLETPISEHCANSPEGFGRPDYEELEFETDGLNEQHVGILNSFAANILRNEPLAASGIEGINGLMISNAAHLSSWTDTTVSLPVDEDIFYAELKKKIASSKTKKTVDANVESDMSKSFQK